MINFSADVYHVDPYRLRVFRPTNGAVVIPPQALNAMGLALAKAAAWGVAQLATRTIDGGFNPDLVRLTKLSDRSLYAELARRENADPAVRETTEGEATLAAQGRATFQRLLPTARAQICPHREQIIKVAGSPELEVATQLLEYLSGGQVPFTLLNPFAVLVSRVGLHFLCGPAPRS